MLLDTPDADGAAIFAETVPTGDPTFAGLLAGVPSRLAVFHVVEPAIKAQIQSDAYATNLAVIEDLAEVGAICSCVAAVRASAPR